MSIQTVFLVGYWKSCRLDKAFNQADNLKRESSGITRILDRLSNINRDDYDGWKNYLQAYYTNFDALHSWASLGFYRRWRRTREINGERLKARFRNTLLRPNTTMPQPTPVTANAHDPQQQQELVAPPLAPSSPSAEQPAPRERSPQLPEVQRRPEENIVAWGAEKFGNCRGTAPMPNEGLKK